MFENHLWKSDIFSKDIGHFLHGWNIGRNLTLVKLEKNQLFQGFLIYNKQGGNKAKGRISKRVF